MISPTEACGVVAIARGDKVRQGIFAKALRGELVPTGRRDSEPASVLLERSRKEREAAGFPARLATLPTERGSRREARAFQGAYLVSQAVEFVALSAMYPAT